MGKQAKTTSTEKLTLAEKVNGTIVLLFIVGAPIALITAFVRGEGMGTTIGLLCVALFLWLVGIYAYDNHQLDRSLNPNR